MTHTFSKIHGLAALRIGWMFGPANIVDAVNRIRGPFNVSTPAMLAAVAAIEDTAHQQMSKAHTEKWRNWLTEEVTKLGLKVTPSVANFVLIHFPQRQGQDLGRGRRVPDQARPGAARAEQLRPAARAAHDHRHRGGQPAGGRRPARLHGAQVNAAPHFDKIALIGFGLIGGSIARAARAQGLAGEIVTTARSAKTRARVEELGIVDSRGRDQCGGGRRRRSRHPLHSRSAPAVRSRRRSPPISSRARSSPTSARSRARSCATWRRICRRACISCRRIRSPAPSIPVPIPVSPNCSSTAGAS